MKEILNIKYSIVQATKITEEQLKSFVDLFSNHYAKWNLDVKPPLLPGGNVKLTKSLLKNNYLFNSSCYAATASNSDNNQHIGQCLYVVYNVPSIGEVRWITQLVVNKEYRNMKIAQNLIHQSLLQNNSSWNAAGLATTNPYSIRALERVTRRRCDPRIISKYANTLIKHSEIPFVHSSIYDGGDNYSLLDVDFNIDNTNVLKILRKEVESGQWKLGDDLPKGHEFFAFVFKK